MHGNCIYTYKIRQPVQVHEENAGIWLKTPSFGNGHLEMGNYLEDAGM
jgi:hypothetical protein